MEEKGPAPQFVLEIVTPERSVLKEEIYVVLLPAAKGYLSAMSHHLPLISTLRPGILEFLGKKRKLSLFVEGGFVEVLPDKVTVMAERVEAEEEIDLERTKALKLEAEEKLKTAPADGDDAPFLAYEEASQKLLLLDKHHFVL